VNLTLYLKIQTMQNKLLAIGMVAATATCATPADAQTGDFHWSQTLRAGQTIEVRGVNGDVRALPSDDAAVRVTASRSARTSDPESVRIEVVEHAGGVTLCAVYPTPRDARRDNDCRPGGGQSNVRDNDVRVDFVVHVPAGVHLEASTVTGDVRTEDLRSEVRASSVNGSVNVRTSERAEASTVNGNLAVRMGGRLAGPIRFSTVNGNVLVEMPGDVGADLHATTVNGAIESDFPISISGRAGPRQVRGTIGSGGPELSVTTVNGGIRLRRI
jgi:hypothetical protein